MSAEMLGRKVEWGGHRGVVVGVFDQPSYAVELADGSRVTVAQNLVTVGPHIRDELAQRAGLSDESARRWQRYREGRL